ncbi:MAG TPA: hypothetical protein VHR86_04245 [Armatimonadota bacterium]|nr:hypothetical protein [Armatimonadota bacterium]
MSIGALGAWLALLSLGHTGGNQPGAALLNAVFADGHAKIWKMIRKDSHGAFDPNWFTYTEGNSNGNWDPHYGHD